MYRSFPPPNNNFQPPSALSSSLHVIWTNGMVIMKDKAYGHLSYRWKCEKKLNQIEVSICESDGFRVRPRLASQTGLAHLEVLGIKRLIGYCTTDNGLQIRK